MSSPLSLTRTLALAIACSLALAAPALATAKPTPKPSARPPVLPVVSQQGVTSAGTPLSLAEAAKIARSRSLAVTTGQQRLLSATLQRQLAVDSSWTSIGVSVAANYNQLPSDSPLLGLLTAPGGGGIVGFPAPGASVDTTLHASQVLFDGFRLHDTLQISDDQISLGRLGVSESEETAMENAALAYFGVLRQEGLAEVATASVQQAKDHLRFGQERLKAGTGTRADVLTLRAQLAQAQGALIQTRNAVNTARLQLDQALNTSTSGRKLVATSQVPQVDVDLDQEIEGGLMRRAEVQQQVLKQHLDLSRATLASRGYWPTLQASSSWAQRGLYQGNFGVGVTLNWELFDGFKTRDNISEALAEVDADATALDQVRQTLALDVRLQGQARQEAKERIAIAQEGLSAADEAYRIAVQRYQLGFSTSTELLDARTTFAQARNTYIQASFDLAVAQVRLAKAVGIDMGQYLSAR